MGFVARHTGFGGKFADAAHFGEHVFNCAKGIRSTEALRNAGAESVVAGLLDAFGRQETMNPGDTPLALHGNARGIPASRLRCVEIHERKD